MLAGAAGISGPDQALAAHDQRLSEAEQTNRCGSRALPQLNDWFTRNNSCRSIRDPSGLRKFHTHSTDVLDGAVLVGRDRGFYGGITLASASPYTPYAGKPHPGSCVYDPGVYVVASTGYRPGSAFVEIDLDRRSYDLRGDMMKDTLLHLPKLQLQGIPCERMYIKDKTEGEIVRLLHSQINLSGRMLYQTAFFSGYPSFNRSVVPHKRPPKNKNDLYIPYFMWAVEMNVEDGYQEGCVIKEYPESDYACVEFPHWEVGEQRIDNLFQEWLPSNGYRIARDYILTLCDLRKYPDFLSELLDGRADSEQMIRLKCFPVERCE
jgi:hypothetical protein